jgi:DNA-binding transcriptional ArsR family regulator
MPKDVSGFDPAQDIRLDRNSLRVIAHPLRVNLLSELRLHGPATASQLARRLGESSGATSYHLRQLALHGFVTEDETRRSGRERWWRSVHRYTFLDLTGELGDPAAGGEYLRAVARNYSAQMLRFAEDVERVDEVYGPEWVKAFTLSDWTLRLTALQAAELHSELFELLNRYRDLPADDRASVVKAQVQLFPLPPDPQS